LGLADFAGLLGVALMLIAYGAAALGRLDPVKAPALILNLTGAILVLYSLSQNFNLAAAVLEGAWALVALFGLVRLAVRPRP
jgi:hypothetical protein